MLLYLYEQRKYAKGKGVILLTVGKKLKEIRKRKGLSQLKLEELSGIAQSTISTIERGATPNVQIANRLAQALNVSIEDLVIDKEPSS